MEQRLHTKHREFHLNMREKFSAARVTEHWNRLPSGLWSLLPWRHSKPPWCNPLEPVSALAQGLDRVVSIGPFQPQPFHDSVIVTSTPRIMLLQTEQDRGMLMLIVNVRTLKAA